MEAMLLLPRRGHLSSGASHPLPSLEFWEAMVKSAPLPVDWREAARPKHRVSVNAVTTSSADTN
ncbi:hypothetical protein ACVWZ6_004536 [Bradyrhizobium sp. GM6.1]